VDAFNDSVWIYAGQLGAEAVKMGFAELQFDYVRFPDEPKGRMANAVFPSRRGKETSEEGVTRNIRMLRERIKALGVPFTIDVFGLTTSAEDDMGIGQKWESLVTSADAVLPMVYPSHYGKGSYGFDHPNAEPYAIIHRAMTDALKRSAPFKNSAEIRPYFQAFTLGKPKYTPMHVREQMRAAEELGIHGWVLWNARSVYERAYLRDASGKTAARRTDGQADRADTTERAVRRTGGQGDTTVKADSAIKPDSAVKPDSLIKPDSIVKPDSAPHDSQP
jgi:hypothetical protein